MSTDTATQLGMLTAFLESEVLPEVGGRNRGKLRATVKLLGDLREETDTRPEVERLLEAGLREQLEGAAASLPGERGAEASRLLARLSAEPGDAGHPDRGRSARLRGVARDFSDLLTADADGGSRPRLAALYGLLRDDALRRHSWQSVFSVKETERNDR